MSGLRLPLAISVAGHAAGLALLLWLSARIPPLVLMPPAPPNAVAVIFEAPPAPPQPAPPQPAPQPPPPPPAKIEPPPPPPPLPLPKPVEVPKPAPVVLPPKPKPPRHIVRRRIERPVRREAPRRQEVERPPAPPIEAPQTASLPPAYRPPVYHPPPAPMISLDYRNELAAWFAAHKHYPEAARDRGEEGTGMLRFRVGRSGRVLSYALVRSTGHPDLDESIEAMMQSAVLPPFPPDMAANDIEVTMPFAFRLEQ